MTKLQILLKIHDFDSELNENYGNQVYFSVGLKVFDLNVKNINEVGALTALFSLIFKTASLKRKPMTK
ncbi:hypothetical protein YC68_24485 [Vibrio parahaemolyticus]|nr:hypothetical protein YC68_24485 [Vibrio parahaemolyticus]